MTVANGAATLPPQPMTTRMVNLPVTTLLHTSPNLVASLARRVSGPRSIRSLQARCQIFGLVCKIRPNAIQSLMCLLGGIAFSYFPATSSAGDFGMVTVDGNTVTTTTDFDNLKTRYGSITPPNSPSSGSESYPACPTANATFSASTTLPPTPNDNACKCLESTLSCRYTPAGQNATVVNVITGTLLDQTCALLGSSGANCNDIGGNGTTGSYGRISYCEPREYSAKKSYTKNNFFVS